MDSALPTAPQPAFPLQVTSNGRLLVDGVVIGSFSVPAPDEELADSPTLELHLGWLRAAGVRVVVHGEPGVDRNRGGIVLARG